MLEPRIEKERAFHDQRFGGNSPEITGKFYVVVNASRARYVSALLEACNHKRVLEYGCGPGSYAVPLAQQGADVTGIDISGVAIQQAREQAAAAGIRANYQVMNAEALTFHDKTFDIICGTGILHHLDLRRAYSEIARTLRADGIAMFHEPLGHNPAINLYRKFTPNLRTEDEHPLRSDDLKLARNYFGNVECHYYHLTSLASIPFRNTPLFGPMRSTLEAIDRVLFAVLPFLKRQAWMVIIRLSAPKRE